MEILIKIFIIIFFYLIRKNKFNEKKIFINVPTLLHKFLNDKNNKNKNNSIIKIIILIILLNINIC